MSRAAIGGVGEGGLMGGAAPEPAPHGVSFGDSRFLAISAGLISGIFVCMPPLPFFSGTVFGDLNVRALPPLYFRDWFP